MVGWTNRTPHHCAWWHMCRPLHLSQPLENAKVIEEILAGAYYGNMCNVTVQITDVLFFSFFSCLIGWLDIIVEINSVI